MASDKTAVSLLLLAFATILALGCGGERTGRDAILNNSSTSHLDRDGSDNQRTGLDFGEDWDRTESARREEQGQRQQRTSARPSAGRNHTASPAAASGGTWAVVLGTFAGENHSAQAQAALQQMRQISSELSRARVESRERGSMVVYGRYDGPEDQRAQRDLARIREITWEGQPIFGRSFISRVRSERATATSRGDNPHTLAAARRQYPNTNPLYSLQVAVWGDFDSGGRISLADIQRQSEAYARELRSQGYEAYFHHDPDKRLSIVTVGLFGRNAIDAETGLFSSDVEFIKRNFPAHLINGEEIQEPIDQRRPGRGTRTQKPFLVQVPR